MNRTLLFTISVFTVFCLIAGQSVLLQTPPHDLLKPREALSADSQESTASLYDNLVRRFRRSIRDLLYEFSDHGGSDGYGDYQRDILSARPQVQKNFNFTLPFFGLQFNYIRLSLDGYLEFSDPPEYYSYPLVFPNTNWPQQNDPSFIGIFYSKCRIGRENPDDLDHRRPGVYFKLESDLDTRSDQTGAQLRARLMSDISEAVEGSDDFIPKYAIIVTWKNMSFAGGIDASLHTTNTFQLVLATDEVRTFVIFNYADLQWLSHSEAGGDTVTGMGGVSAFVGFNKGNGTQSYEYLPYSQSAKLRDITSQGCSLPGRHVFRIDQEIVLGTCKKTTTQV